MTLLDYAELCQYWAKNPPTHLMVAAYLGVGKPADGASPQAPQQSAQAQREVIAEILKGGGAAVINRSIFEKSGPVPTFDFDELMKRKPSAAQQSSAQGVI